MEIKKLEMFTSGNDKRVSIASGPVIVKGNKVLLVRGKDGDSFKFPGGYLLDNESFKQTAVREAQEEISCLVEVRGEPVFYYIYNAKDNLDIILIHYLAEIIDGTPKPTTEIEEVKWFDINTLPENVMENVIPAIRALLK